MATETVRARNGKGNMLQAPPGFVSRTSFILKREEINSSAVGRSQNESEPPQMDIDYTRRHRPWILYDQSRSTKDPESKQPDMIPPSKTSLPKGVTRGCSKCSDCQKVTARWHPGEACISALDEAPVFCPSEEEFKDPIKYIASICPQAESCGICRIVPPHSWKPACLLKEKTIWESSKFPTCIQRIDELRKQNLTKQLLGKGKGGRKGTSEIIVERESGDGCTKNPDSIEHYCEECEPKPGPEFTLEMFKKYADDFVEQYFSKEEKNSSLVVKKWEPSVEDVEGEYMRIIENPTEQIEVLHGDGVVEFRGFGSESVGILNSTEALKSHKYEDSVWNLNNLAKLPGSLLASESERTSEVLLSRFFVGMCFSSVCWRVEEHNLYSIHYVHLGDPKIWYGTPGSQSVNVEAALKKQFLNLSVQYPELLLKHATQLSPSILKSEGISVKRCVQYPGEFVIVFPGAFHSGFDCGFNVSEKANVAPLDWLPHGQNAVELYSYQGRKTSISYDKILLSTACETVRAHREVLLRNESVDNLRLKDAFGKDSILARVLKARIKQEGRRREYLCNMSQSRQMEADFDETSKRECFVCFYDLYLSAAGCVCSPEKYTCLKHSKQLCCCGWSSRTFLFRYSMSELNVLLDAVEGKLSAVFRWSKDKLGLALSSSSSSRPACKKQKTEVSSACRSDVVIVISDDDSDT